MPPSSLAWTLRTNLSHSTPTQGCPPSAPLPFCHPEHVKPQFFFFFTCSLKPKDRVLASFHYMWSFQNQVPASLSVASCALPAHLPTHRSDSELPPCPCDCTHLSSVRNAPHLNVFWVNCFLSSMFSSAFLLCDASADYLLLCALMVTSSHPWNSTARIVKINCMLPTLLNL